MGAKNWIQILLEEELFSLWTISLAQNVLIKKKIESLTSSQEKKKQV